MIQYKKPHGDRPPARTSRMVTECLIPYAEVGALLPPAGMPALLADWPQGFPQLIP